MVFNPPNIDDIRWVENHVIVSQYIIIGEVKLMIFDERIFVGSGFKVHDITRDIEKFDVNTSW